MGDTKPTAPVKDSSKDSQARQSGGEKNKSAQNSVEKKLCQGRSSLSSDKSKLSDKPENKTQYASKRPSFKEELEAWRLRNLQSKSSNLKELAHESQGKCAPLKLPVKRRNEDSLVKKDSKRQMKQQEWYSSEEESSDKEVYSFEDLMKEEERSARIAAKEDAEEYRKEQERKRKKKLKRLAMKQKRE